MIQGLNTGPGERIRCAILEPVEEGGETVLRVRMHRGHTAREGQGLARSLHWVVAFTGASATPAGASPGPRSVV
jgi:hypothetical protein